MPTTTLTLTASPSPVEYDVIVSQHGVPQATMRVSVEGCAELVTKRAVRDSIAATYEDAGYTFDLVEPRDEDGHDLAVRSMMALNPGFAAHVRGEL